MSAPTEPLLPPPPPGRESPMLSAHRQRYVASIRVSVEVYGGRARVGETLCWVCRVSWSSYFSLTNLAIGTSTFQELYGRSISQLSPNASSHAIVALQSVVLSFSHAADIKRSCSYAEIGVMATILLFYQSISFFLGSVLLLDV